MDIGKVNSSRKGIIIMDKFELYFTQAYRTRRKTRYNEELGEVELSEAGTAIDYLYIRNEAIELLGYPHKIRITIEPIKE